MRLVAGLLLAAACARAETWTYWIEPCTPELSKHSGCSPSDAELGVWALEAWQKAGEGGLRLTPASEQSRARIRIHWAWGSSRLYGEARPILMDGKRGAAIYVVPEMASLGPDIHAAASRDPLLRDSIVYLTCLHESGHALGLPHTARFEDIMYSFGFGGDIVEYFARYRRQLGSRSEIRKHSGISGADREKLLVLFEK
jgi:hypothetical protein